MKPEDFVIVLPSRSKKPILNPEPLYPYALKELLRTGYCQNSGTTYFLMKNNKIYFYYEEYRKGPKLICRYELKRGWI